MSQDDHVKHAGSDDVDAGSTPPRSAALDAQSFRAVANYTYDWESWHGLDGRLFWVNPAVERVTGVSVDECMELPDYPLPFVADDDRERIQQVLDNASERTSGNDVEFRVVHRRGDVKWMAISWQPMFDDHGACRGFRTSVRDITERRQMRDQLRVYAEHLEQLVQDRTARIQQLEQHRRQMEKMAALGQLAAGVAHEINNPLAGIRNAFELIKSDLAPGHEHYDLLELIDGEIDRIGSITHQMYQLYRPNPQTPQPFDIGQAVLDVTRLLGGVAEKNCVKLRTPTGSGSMLVRLPEGEVKQILYNLIRNAIQASPADRDVTVHIEQGSEGVHTAVRDEGPGIPDDILSRIFDPFFTTKGEDPKVGMGLGLSVSRSLIEAMGGRIDVESQLGRGSVFTAVFPKRITGANGEIHD